MLGSTLGRTRRRTFGEEPGARMESKLENKKNARRLENKRAMKRGR